MFPKFWLIWFHLHHIGCRLSISSADSPTSLVVFVVDLRTCCECTHPRDPTAEAGAHS